MRNAVKIILSLFAIFYLSLPLFPYTLDQILTGIGSHIGKIKSIRANITINSKMNGTTMKQTADYQYDITNGMVLHLISPENKIIQITPDGSMFENGVLNQKDASSYLFNDLYFLSFLKYNQIIVDHEDIGVIYLKGYLPSMQLIDTNKTINTNAVATNTFTNTAAVLTADVDSTNMVINSLNYAPQGAVAINFQIQYQYYQDVPFTSIITVAGSNPAGQFTEDIRFDSVNVELK
jgi:hypothetical protein